MNRLKAEMIFALLFSCVFAALATQMAFLQLWYKEAGLSDVDLGVLWAVGFIARAGGSLALPALSDRSGRPGATLALLGLAGALATLGHLVSPETLWGMMAANLILGVAFAGMIPIIDARCWGAAEEIGFTYRRPRAIGSFAFLAAMLGIGALTRSLGLDFVVFFIAGAMLAIVAIATGAQRAIGAAAQGREPPSWSGGLQLLAQPRFAWAIAASSFIQASHAALYVYGSVHWDALDFTEFQIGALWAWGVFAEIVFFFLSAGWIARMGPARCLMAAGALAALRWGAMTQNPGLEATFLLQTLHLGSFALTHMAAMSFIAREAPPELAASAHGVFSAMHGGVGMAVAASILAWAYPAFGGGAYWVGALFALSGLLCAIAMRRARSRPAALGH